MLQDRIVKMNGFADGPYTASFKMFQNGVREAVKKVDECLEKIYDRLVELDAILE